MGSWPRLPARSQCTIRYPSMSASASPTFVISTNASSVPPGPPEAYSLIRTSGPVDAEDSIGAETLIMALTTATPAHAATTDLAVRSEEHTSELQSRGQLVCRLLLEKKKHFMTKNIINA